ncbi:MAG: aromatic amino acid ammonia-lyase [Prevotellaceae bacterium]|jgi:histidine ammonia-lyase|nr:aromatic amino acid ammonia-lyase [Prevotellaceae bacterium]
MIEKTTLREIYPILFDGKPLDVKDEHLQHIRGNYDFLKRFSAEKIIYGVNTGFGPMAQYRIDDSFVRELQFNIIRSHSTGAGKALDAVYVKASMIVRLNNLLQAKSGVHPELILLLKAFINRDIIPFVPEHGSVGASGDLVQLAHIALALIGEGEVFHKGELRETAEVLKENSLSPIDMHIREGLAVTNGTSVMTGIGIVNLYYAQRLMYWSTAFSVFINEVFSSYDDLMSPVLNKLKRHEGQRKIAELMSIWREGSDTLQKRESTLYNQQHHEKVLKHKVQPYYSLRCIPQILGPVYDAIVNVEKVLTDEFNSVCDNPVVDEETQNVYHGGNFHGDYVSFEMDKLKIAITKLTMLAERQLNYLLHDKINETLPPFANLGTPGLNYGLQAAQFTATSTTAECQTLSHPMYIHSIPNNNDNQDIVSMGTNSALLAKTVIDNSYQVLSVFAMGLAQAVDCLKIRDKLSRRSQKLYDDIRNIVPLFIKDTPKYKEIEKMTGYLKTTAIENRF